MDTDQARERLYSERSEVESLLRRGEMAAELDREAQREVGDAADPAQALSAEGTDDSIVAGLRDRLAAIDRAIARLDAGTYGFSVRSGKPIPPERLEADPAAELTVEEALAGR
jgi:RNA polymerase-binding transcription factor